MSGFNAKLIIREKKKIPTNVGTSTISNNGSFCMTVTVTERAGCEWCDGNSCSFKEARKRREF